MPVGIRIEWVHFEDWCACDHVGPDVGQAIRTCMIASSVRDGEQQLCFQMQWHTDYGELRVSRCMQRICSIQFRWRPAFLNSPPSPATTSPHVSHATHIIRDLGTMYGLPQYSSECTFLIPT